MDHPDLGVIGPKAESLERMRQASLPVPTAFYLPGSDYREHLRSNGLLPMIDSRVLELEDRFPDAGDTVAPEAALSEIRKAIAQAPLADSLVSRLTEGFERLGSPPVAIRSSATAEDLPGASFAGQHGTFFAADLKEVCRHVKGCWASLWTDRAFAYRDRADFDHMSVDMAVIVQRLVPAQAAGVAFTADPVTGEAHVVVEAVHGIGESLVSGKVTPDRWVMERPGLEVTHRAFATKSTMIEVVEGGRVTEHDVPVGLDGPAIDEPTARRVAKLAVAAEELFGVPVDVEWAVEGDTIWLLQSRPVTTLGRSASGEPTFVWSNANVGEVLPDVVSPMNWWILQDFIGEMLVGLFGKIGVTISDQEVVRLFGGRAYFNITVLASAFRHIPGGRGLDLSEYLGGMQDVVEIPQELLDYDVPNVHGSTLRTLSALPGIIGYLSSHSPKKSIQFCADARARTESALGVLKTDHDEDSLVDVIRDQIEDLKFMSDGLGFAGTAMSHWGSLTGVTKRWLGDDDLSVATGLLAAQGDVVSAEAGMSMWSLAAAARKHPAIVQALGQEDPWESVRPRLVSQGPRGELFLSAWDAFMAEYGHHSRGELEVANARWAERPDYVLDIVRGYVAEDPSHDIDAQREDRARARGKLVAECRAKLRNPLKRMIFDRFLVLASEGARARELVKSEGVRRMAAIRWLLLALGETLVARHTLEQVDDVFYLTLDELDTVRTGRSGFDYLSTIKRRRADRERDSKVDPPPVIIGEWDAKTGRTPSLAVGTDILRGIGVSPGSITGPARVIAQVEDEETVLPGEILVAPFTDPGWTPYFMPAAGIVMDMGGMLSHGSIIAREYGIPAVVNVGPATKVIRTGQMIRIDADAGEVHILD